MQQANMNLDYQERRRENRKRVKVSVLLKMGTYLKGRAYTKDISPSGMYLVSPNMFGQIRQNRVDDFIGSSIKIYFPAKTLTINGTIARVERLKGGAGIKITDTSDDELWQEMCRDAICL
ncbi:MAG: PilZ domain-containing protein [Deltaproteobacteria bacterium]|nr:PilZ domain-containing protein [Deltaproteobacteria bacterium]